MGVPKFYRWISERYPCLSQVVVPNQLPEFDNMYLDMNGIIHSCSHPNDDDVHFRISEEQIFRDIFRYLDFLFQTIKPRKVFFMAIDGVAPRAKMNQQRGRRFRSAKDAEKREKEAVAKGQTLPSEARFDSNCITPGTPFMDRLHKALQWYISDKISSDPDWQSVRVILSGHETPGEGEHKIMDFIRYERSQPGYDADTRHCLYGLDADLIILGLCSHEPHFSLLREEVKFIKPKATKVTKSFDPRKINFHLLHLSLFRDYLGHEFASVKKSISFNYDLECIIDDWIIMTFLVGNDFIPNLPHFHINRDSLTLLYSAYKQALPLMGGYMNENGTLNLKRFEIFLQKVSQIDENTFREMNDLSPLDGFTSGGGGGRSGRQQSDRHAHRNGGRSDHTYSSNGNNSSKNNWHDNNNGQSNHNSSYASRSNGKFNEDRSPNGKNNRGAPQKSFDAESILQELKDQLKDVVLPTVGNENRILQPFYSDDENERITDEINSDIRLSGLYGRTKNRVQKSQQSSAHSQQNHSNHNNVSSQLNSNHGKFTIDQSEWRTPGKRERIAMKLQPQQQDQRQRPQQQPRRQFHSSGGSKSSPSPDSSSPDNVSSEESDNSIDEEFRAHKAWYYQEKLEYTNVDESVLIEQATCYIRALQWNLHYYYNGCVSWSWYYPHHYAPYISDVKNFANVDLTFEKGHPFMPFDQLLAVLPAASKNLLPQSYQELVTDPNSKLISSYPKDFELDLNEKKQDWEAVVKIPFIDEHELLEAVQIPKLFFSPDEKRRNQHGPHLQFEYVPEQLPPYDAPFTFMTSIFKNHARLTKISQYEYQISPDKIIHGLLPNAKTDQLTPGFPKLKFIPHIARLRRARVRVFEMPSRNESFVLDILPPRQQINLNDVANTLLGKSVYINWPHLVEATAIEVTDFTHMIAIKNGKITRRQLEERELKEAHQSMFDIKSYYFTRYGINIGTTFVVIKCLPKHGHKIPQYAPYQTVLPMKPEQVKSSSPPSTNTSNAISCQVSSSSVSDDLARLFGNRVSFTTLKANSNSVIPTKPPQHNNFNNNNNNNNNINNNGSAAANRKHQANQQQRQQQSHQHVKQQQQQAPPQQVRILQANRSGGIPPSLHKVNNSSKSHSSDNQQSGHKATNRKLNDKPNKPTQQNPHQEQFEKLLRTYLPPCTTIQSNVPPPSLPPPQPAAAPSTAVDAGNDLLKMFGPKITFISSNGNKSITAETGKSPSTTPNARKNRCALKLDAS